MATIAPPSTKDMLLDAISQTLGEGALETVQPSEAGEAPEAPSTLPTEAPSCITQRPIPMNFKGGPADIVVGLNAEVPRWVPGSVIKWAAWRAGFKTQEDADYAAEQLNLATQQWNNANVGVTFEWVPLAKDATFVICNGGAMGGVLASAFFPNGNDLNYLYVYTAAFRPSWKPFMWKVFTHELGHVLGLRHEFAIEKEQEGAVQLGPQNPMSVMNYRPEPPEIQPSDIESTKMFYDLKEDAQGNSPRVGLTDVNDYTPK